MAKQTKTAEKGHLAKASSKSLPISTKHSVEISSHLRYRSTTKAKEILEGVVDLKTAVPFKKFRRDVGHKAGMAAGRYPKKAASAFLKLVKSVESNAQELGLDVNNLKIQKIVANKASIPSTGGRTRGSPKRTHLEIEVKEFKAKKEKKVRAKKTEQPKKQPEVKAKEPVVKVPVKEESKPVEKVVEKPAEVKKVEEKSTEEKSQSNEASK